MGDMAPSAVDHLEIHSEPRGPHWVAWVPRPQDGKPEQSVVLVGKSREEAEARVRAWAAARPAPH